MKQGRHHWANSDVALSRVKMTSCCCWGQQGLGAVCFQGVVILFPGAIVSGPLCGCGHMLGRRVAAGGAGCKAGGVRWRGCGGGGPGDNIVGVRAASREQPSGFLPASLKLSMSSGVIIDSNTARQEMDRLRKALNWEVRLLSAPPPSPPWAHRLIRVGPFGGGGLLLFSLPDFIRGVEGYVSLFPRRKSG